MLQWISALLLFALSFVFADFAHAAPTQTPAKNAQNSFCQIEAIGPADWKIYSPANPRPLVLRSENLKKYIEPRINQALKDAGRTPGDANYQLYLRCSEVATELVFDFDQGDAKSCVVYEPRSHTASVFSNNDPEASAACTGQTPQTLTIGLQDPNLAPETERMLSTRYPDLFQDLENDQGFLLLLKLKEKFRFHEDEAKRQLESDSDLMSRAEFVDYEHIGGLLADSTPLVTSSL